MAFKVQKTEPTGVVYADTSKPDTTIRFKGTTTPKSLNGVSSTNYVQEIIYNDLNAVTVGGVSAKDPVSVRIRTSGAIESKARLKQLLLSAAAQLDDWVNEDVFSGFPPVTVPVLVP